MEDYESIAPESMTEEESHVASFSPFGTFGKDDILLLGLILMFLTDDSLEDKSILIILAFLFFSGLS